MMRLFKQHFAVHDFLLGDRACIADFALVGPAKAHFLHDPLPYSWLTAEDNEAMLCIHDKPVVRAGAGFEF